MSAPRNDPRPVSAGQMPGHRRGPAEHTPRVVVADRGDALVPHLTRALADRYEVVGRVDAQLTSAERLLVAATTFRPSRRAWVERFYKSNLAVHLRSRSVARQLAQTEPPYDVVLQTHALFEVKDQRTVLYVDCTHRQSAEQWPDWNPLRGRALQRWYDRERRQYQQAAHVLAFSHDTQRSLVEDYAVPADHVSVVGAGVNFEEAPVAPPVRSTSAPTVLFVGNDFERKGGQVLLEAFRIVRQGVPDARLRLVGEPHGIPPEPGVEILGRVGSRQEMSQIYAQASVFCLPTHFDPFALVVLEAMAHGLPCVVTPSCGTVEMVVEGVTGRFVDHTPLSAASLAATLVELLTDPEACHRMGAAGRRRVEEKFLWSHVVDRMAPVFERLASSGRPPEQGAPETGPPRSVPSRPTTAAHHQGARP